MRSKLFAVLIVTVLTGAAVAVYFLRPVERQIRDLAGFEGDVNRGAYLARASGCFGCHTDSRKKGPVLAGGGAMKTPFGTFYPPNITTHPEDGLGAWTRDQFAAALTEGIGPDGQNYYPAFIYPHYTAFSDQDIADLWAAFRTVPPVQNSVPGHDLPFPFGFRFLLNGWKRLFFDQGAFKPDPAQSPEWNRGAYLATGPTHCVACHTPRNIFGAHDYAHDLKGTADGPNGEKVPAISGDELRKKGWSKKALAFALRTGIMPDGDAFGGTMGEVVQDSTRWLNNADLDAIAEYVMSVGVDAGKIKKGAN